MRTSRPRLPLAWLAAACLLAAQNGAAQFTVEELDRNAKLTPAMRRLILAYEDYLQHFPNGPRATEFLIDEGGRFRDAGDNATAVRVFRRVLDRGDLTQGDRAYSFEQIMASYQALGQYELQEEWAHRMAVADVGRDKQQQAKDFIFTAGYNRAKALEDSSRLEAAGEAYERLSVRNPDHDQAPNAMLRAASLYEQGEDPARAARTYERFYYTYPDYKDPQTGKGALVALETAAVLYYEMEDYRHTADATERILAAAPDHPSRKQYMNNLAAIYALLKDYNNAIRVRQQFIVLYPGDSRVRSYELDIEALIQQRDSVQVRVSALTGPPRLELAATFEEPSGNRALDAGEEATLALAVRNTGRGSAAGLRAAVTGQAPGLTVTPPEAVPSLAVNGETTLRIRLRADGTAQDRTVRLRVVVEEARGFNSDTLVVEFETRAERPPELSIARLGLNDVTGERTFGNGDGQFQPGESAEVIAFVENAGTGKAEAVTAEITTGHEHIYLLQPPNGIALLGDIPPLGYAELALVLTVAPVYSGPPTLPIRVKLSDRRERYRWELPLGLALLARTPTIQTVRVEAASEAPATGRATPTVSGPGAAQRRPDTSFSVAVLPLDCPGMSEREVLTLTERLRVSLYQTGVFQVMERGKMEEILHEQGFQQSGCTTTECAVEIGQLLAVRQMVAGSVGKVGATYSVSLRVFDVETGQTLATVTQDCAGCVVDRILQLTLPQASAALAGEVLRDVSRR